MVKHALPILLSTLVCTSAQSALDAAAGPFPFRDRSLPLEARVADLVGRMTLEEKVAQMFDKAPAIERLGVPRYEWWNEALHGIARAGTATVFPQAIGLAASFDRQLVYQVATAIATEGRAKHHDFRARGTYSMYTGLNYWSPNINIFRDPRWGRGQETYGEDPYLTGRMAVSFVRGLQGDDPQALKTGATLKHYAVHSGPEPSRHSDDYSAGDYDLYATYLSAFETVIRETHVHALMCAYNAVNGVPACANRRLLQDILRGEFGFDGYVVSDCGAIADIYKTTAHDYVEGTAEAAAIAVKAGVDLECGDADGSAYRDLPGAVAGGLIDEKTITAAVTRLMRARFRLGMFDPDGGSHAGHDISQVGSPAHLRLALQAAKKAIVLLQNDGVLPLAKNASIALIGPNADNVDILLANYHGQPVNPATPRQALLARGDTLLFSPGSALAGDIYTHYETVPGTAFSHRSNGEKRPGLIAQYYPAPDFTGDSVKTEVVENIDKAWRRSPVNGRDDDAFGVRYTGFFTPAASGRYRFGGNVNLSLDGRPVSGPIALQGGRPYRFEGVLAIRRFWHANAIEPRARLSWLDLNRDLAGEALSAAAKSDVIVFMGGISAKLEGEEMTVAVAGFDGGDRTTLAIPAAQMALLKQLKSTAKPLVYVNFSGSAVNLEWPKANANAVVQAFYPGEATGPALAQILYGEYSPSARLPVTFYRSVDDLPAFKDYSMAGRTHRYFSGRPVYAFGAGRGFSEFDTRIIDVARTGSPDRALRLSVELHNKGAMDAEEVLQLYVEPGAAQGREIQALKHFTVAAVAAGERQVVTVEVPAHELVFRDRNGRKKPYHGPVNFRLGHKGDPKALKFRVNFKH